jgi:hypothetical protein
MERSWRAVVLLAAAGCLAGCGDAGGEDRIHLGYGEQSRRLAFR